MNRPIRQSFFTIQPERADSLLERSLIFGLSERVGASGKIEKAVEIGDLEFLAAKLKLHKVEDIAVGLLHANVNPEHEQLVGKFLGEQGFRVHLSSELSNHEYEVARWWAAITNSYLRHRHDEIFEELKVALSESGQTEVPFRLLDGRGVIPADAPNAPLGSLFGSILALNRWRQGRGSQALLFLGIEDFWLLDGRWPERGQWRADYGPVASPHPSFVRCDLQLTQLVEHSFWGGVSFSRIEGGFEPGPKSFGKGLIPQCLDIMWILGRIGEIPGLSDRFQERSRGRIQESLTALARKSAHSQPLPPEQSARELESEAVRRLAAQISWGAKEVTICGPLADVFRPALAPVLQEIGIKADWLSESSGILEAMADFSVVRGDARESH